MKINASNLPSILCLLFALATAFTPFYSLGFLAVIILGAHYVNFSRIFSTLFSRIVLSLLMFLGIIMVTGMLTWFVKVPLHPLYVLLIFVGFIAFLLSGRLSTVPRDTRFFDKNDLFGLILGVVTPLIVCVSYFTPNLTDESLYQVLSNGWDNASHVLMLETASMEKGYVYGPLEEVESKTIHNVNAYPQAWHLASSVFANGFGGNLFNPEHPFVVMKAYYAVIVFWFVVAAYMMTIIARFLASRFRKERMPNLITTGTTVAVLLITQLLTITGSLQLGFANYIGLMAYLLIFMSALLEPPDQKNFKPMLLVATLACVAGSMCWFLAIPALIASLVLYAAHFSSYNGKQILLNLRKYKFTVFICALLMAIIVSQVLIFVIYSGISPTTQLVEAGGTYRISEILTLALVAIAAAYAYKAKNKDVQLKNLAILLAPLIILTIALYIYQMLFAYYVSYYFFKLIVLIILFAGVFSVPPLIQYAHSIHKKLDGQIYLSVPIILATLSMLIIGSSQTMQAYSIILQRNSVVSYSAAKSIVKYLKTQDPNKTKLILITDRSKEGRLLRNDDVNGDLVSKIPHIPYTCAYYVNNSYKASQTLKAKLKRLEQCADTLTDKRIIVVTNTEKIRDKVLLLNKKNIHLKMIQ